ALLVPSESPSALASAIRSIRENPRAARERASAALSLVAERYASGPWLARYDAVYAQLLVARALGTRNRPGRSAGHTA
ncbi:MAG: glycosyltransferase, partial [Gemmatimonadaceae bacterium]